MEKIFQKYLSKHVIWQPEKGGYTGAGMRVVVPVFLEENYIFSMLESLSGAAVSLSFVVELVLVFNCSANASPEIKQRQQKLLTDMEQLSPKQFANIHLTFIKAFDLPAKHAGAGWARKIGMDYSVSQFINEDNQRGVIVSLDADCKVSSNYFIELHKVFDSRQTNGCTIYFEHDVKGVDSLQKEAVEQYELHLRYYLQVLRWTGHPYAYHTVGSCFAIRAEAYVRAGGMPRKQAGEDFYFLQKVIPLGKFRELHSACVYPSARISDRVPFGTGPAIDKLLKETGDYQTYNLQAFIDLKAFFNIKEELYKVNEEGYKKLIDELSGRLRSFLMNSGFYPEIVHISENCSSPDSFNKRFFEVFDAFKVVKYLNYVHTHFLEKTTVFDASLDFLEYTGKDTTMLTDSNSVLEYYRRLEKNIVQDDVCNSTN